MFIKVTERTTKARALIPLDTIDYIEFSSVDDTATIYYKNSDEHTDVFETSEYFIDKLTV